MDKAPDAFRTISEVADGLDIPQHVLRFWETRFTQIKPMKRSGGRRYYRPDDVDLLRGIRHLLYGEGYTIRGVQRILREQGIKSVQGLAHRSGVPLSVVTEPHGGSAPEHVDDIAEVDAGLIANLDIDLNVDLDFEDSDEDDDVDDEADAPLIVQRHPPVRAPALDFAVDPRRDAIGAPQIGSPQIDFAVMERVGLSKADAASLTAALEDLMACKKLVDEAVKTTPPDVFPLK